MSLKDIDIDSWGGEESIQSSRIPDQEYENESRSPRSTKLAQFEKRLDELERLVVQQKHISLTDLEKMELAEIFVSYISQYQTKSPSRAARAEIWIDRFGIREEYEKLKSQQPKKKKQTRKKYS